MEQSKVTDLPIAHLKPQPPTSHHPPECAALYSVPIALYPSIHCITSQSYSSQRATRELRNPRFFFIFNSLQVFPRCHFFGTLNNKPTWVARLQYLCFGRVASSRVESSSYRVFSTTSNFILFYKNLHNRRRLEMNPKPNPATDDDKRHKVCVGMLSIVDFGEPIPEEKKKKMMKKANKHKRRQGGRTRKKSERLLGERRRTQWPLSLWFWYSYRAYEIERTWPDLTTACWRRRRRHVEKGKERQCYISLGMTRINFESK